MTMTAQHTMETSWIEDRQVSRYTCRSCARCVEDGPDGLRVLVRGDQTASHRGGVFAAEVELEIEADPLARVLH